MVDNGLNRTVLIEQWRRLYGCLPPKYLSLQLIQSVLAWEEQSRVMGGVPAKILRTLHNASGLQTAKRITTLNTGAVLVREWNGVLHEVEVLADGYLWQGQRHRSLSAIARAITGTRWSGPRFFGSGRSAR